MVPCMKDGWLKDWRRFESDGWFESDQVQWELYAQIWAMGTSAQNTTQLFCTVSPQSWETWQIILHSVPSILRNMASIQSWRAVYHPSTSWTEYQPSFSLAFKLASVFQHFLQDCTNGMTLCTAFYIKLSQVSIHCPWYYMHNHCAHHVLQLYINIFIATHRHNAPH